MNAAEAKSVSAARRKQREARAVDSQVIRSIMSTPNGRAWMWRQLESWRIFEFNETLDPHFMAYEKGRRSAGYSIFRDIQRFTPSDYLRMINESTGVEVEPQENDDDDNDPS